MNWLSAAFHIRRAAGNTERSGAQRQELRRPDVSELLLLNSPGKGKGGSARDWRRPRPIEEARRNAEANWKQPPTGKEGGMCLSPRRRLTPGNSEKAEKKTKRTGFLEESGAERERAHGRMGNVVPRNAATKNRCVIRFPPASRRSRDSHLLNVSWTAQQHSRRETAERRRFTVLCCGGCENDEICFTILYKHDSLYSLKYSTFQNSLHPQERNRGRLRMRVSIKRTY